MPITPVTITITVDATDTRTLAESLRKLDAVTRQRMAEALENVEAAEVEAQVVEEVRVMMTALYPQRPVRGVVFCYTDDYPTSVYVSDGCGDVLFEDGEAVENVFFDEVRSDGLDLLLRGVSERAGWCRTVVVDLRENTVGCRETQYGTHSLFGEPEPE